MKHIGIGLMIMITLVGCGGSAATGVRFDPPKCDTGGVCVRHMEALLDDQVLTLAFDLVDINGEVWAGVEPRMNREGETDLVGLYLGTDTTGTFLYGTAIDRTAYLCYAGNDIPGKDGRMASTCSLSFPANQMQQRPKVGDTVTVDMYRFGIATPVVIGANNN